MANNCYPFENLPLPYGYCDLEPYIDEKTMEVHHQHHLQAYIDSLNQLLSGRPTLQAYPLERLAAGTLHLPQPLRTQLRHAAGGVYNHRFYFSLLQNPAPAEPSGELAEAIGRCFGSFDQFKTAFRTAALSVFGSGYAWLVWGRQGLRIVTTPNQNNPLAMGLCPIFNVDVWEHAYYLKHCWNRGDYLDCWFQVVNWGQAEENYRMCRQGQCWPGSA